MRCTSCLLALSTLSTLITAVPFTLQDGDLQKHRRRAVDYPILSNENEHPERLSKRSLRKRSLPYSVVPVNGGAASSAPVTITDTIQGTPVVRTIYTTQPPVTVTPAVETVVHTSVVTANGPEETILVTMTQAVSTSAPQVTAASHPETETVVVTASPSPTSTKYYDNGLWHTTYPVWSPSNTPAPYPTDGTTFNARAQGTGAVAGAAYPTGSYGKRSYPRLNRRADAPAAVVKPDIKWDLTHTEFNGLRRFMSQNNLLR